MLAMIFFLIVVATELSVPDTFVSPFYVSGPFVLSDYFAEFWPKQILIALSIFMIFEAIYSGKTETLIGNINISGNTLIPVLILVYLLVVVGYVLSSNITYPSRLADAGS
jgi:hypothetical protein